ncbi:MAG: YhcH/YjgK/YiaL family protein [Ignavibacteriaceae bacterium]|nr:YhcH/YjgK/YiaL family protein [Ignavibacteriaceae bacterium]
MIIDLLNNADMYKSISLGIQVALEYITTTDFSKTEPGRYKIDGENIFALVSEYQTKAESKAKLEAHKKYIDVQFAASGSEKIGYSPLTTQNPFQPYDEVNDYSLYEGEKSFIKLAAGMFAIFFPEDLHMPGISIDEPNTVKKVVVKVRV